MDKSRVKNFAVSARIKLKEQIEQKAYTFGITKKEIKKVETFEDTFEINGNKYNKRLLKHRESLVKKINEKGFDEVIEEVAYTWFNRIIAIRFMEVNEYLPTGVRVLSSTDSSKVEPDIIREAANLDFENLNIDLIYKLQDENNTEELFKYLLIKQCNELGKIMPVVFEEIEDFTELLLPDNLLQEGSIIRELVTSINEEDFKEQVEIIGWLYQYYISEKKDEVFADLKKNVKITKENIPAATQLFTPDWIVKYMVENSLGRLWLEKLKIESGELKVENIELKEKWKYYLEEAEQEPEVMKQLREIREENKGLRPEDIKFLDPCMGSGHILVYAFDVLYDIYKSAGYSEREIPKLILTKNLYGLDIDDRAAQLAYFAVMMKARSYNRRIFRDRIELNICAIQESNLYNGQFGGLVEYFCGGEGTVREQLKNDFEYLINVFNDAKEYGSILEVEKIDFEAIERRIEEIRNGDTDDIFEWQYKNVILEKIPVLIKQAKIMSGKYDVVCTNPPYMGSIGMNEKLSLYIELYYSDYKTDLFSVFMRKAFDLSKNYISMITQPNWLSIKSFNKLREFILTKSNVVNMLHMGRGIFGVDFGSASFTLRKGSINNYKSDFFRLFEKTFKYINPDDIRNIFFEAKNNSDYMMDFTSYYNNNEDTAEEDNVEQDNEYRLTRLRHSFKQENFMKISNCPFIYWISSEMLMIFSEQTELGKITNCKKGLSTSDDKRFLKLWFEVNEKDTSLGKLDKFKKWYPINKGGSYRKWYGNREYIINWDNNGLELKKFKKSVIRNEKFYFNHGITWTYVPNGRLQLRFFEEQFIFAAVGPSIFGENLLYILGLLNSKVGQTFINFVSGQTITYEVGEVSKIPVMLTNEEEKLGEINNLVLDCIDISRKEWNLYETSWDFMKHPFMHYKEQQNIIQEVFDIYSNFQSNQFEKLRQNEEQLNKIFIEIYRIQDELNYKVLDKDITIRKANKVRDTKSFISYAVGCMFGRYSLDEEGLIYAGGVFNQDRYKTFKVDIDNVIPITDDEYFEDDIVSRFVEFVKITFGKETLEENLDYIADTLGKKGNETSRQTIRRYFLKDFYKDHLKTYQKRPIYWLFDSGKNDGFKALIYMHRYDIATVARVRTDYLHLLQRKYEAEVNRLDMTIESSASAREKTEAKKKKEKIQKQILECIQYDQIIAHVANQKISIDLDDGVNVNYGKFQGVEVPQGEGKKALMADLLAKI